MSWYRFTQAILFFFLLTFIASVSSDGLSELQSSIVQQSDESESLPTTSRSSSVIGSAKINDLLNDNFHNGTLRLDFSTGWYEDYDSSAIRLLDHLLSPNGEHLRDSVRQIIVPWYAGDTIGHFVDFTSPDEFNNSRLVDLVAEANNLQSLR